MKKKSPPLREVLEIAEDLWPAKLAEPWDASGLVSGHLEQPVRKILWAVDPVEQTVAEATTWGADLMITHHPLYLKPTTTLTPYGTIPTPLAYKGKLIHSLIEHRCALLTVHTNGDSVLGGVSDTLAEALGLAETRPLILSEVGISEEGIGRIGSVTPEVPLAQFAERVMEVLPAVAGGVRVAGNPQHMVGTVALCSGAGDGLLHQVMAAQADVYVTADLRHHPASEARETAKLYGDGPALIDVSHFASEWLWLPKAAQALDRRLQENNYALEIYVSVINTDPWDFILTPDK